MNAPRTSMTILLADDDFDDCRLAVEALQKSRLSNDLRVVHDGEELLDYLFQRGDYSVPGTAPRPGVILLDLNMPRMDGREALAQIKANPDLRRIPGVVLTTSQSDGDIYRSYDLGASSYLTKPVTFLGLVGALHTLGRYRFEIVQLAG